MPQKFNKDRFNEILREYGQELRMYEVRQDYILLSNWMEIRGYSEVVKCKRRVMREVRGAVDKFDAIYSGLVDVKEYDDNIRRIHGSVGGKVSQEKYGDMIIAKNLTRKGKGGGFKKGQVPWNKGKNKENNDVLAKLSRDRIGENNPMYGTSYDEEYRKKQSVRMKSLILSGKFTPKSNNRNTNWESSYGGERYRSSWEAFYAYTNPAAAYEELRIKYVYGGKECVYIVDFIDHDSRLAIEVKPARLFLRERELAKWEALVKWAEENSYLPIQYTENNIVEYIHSRGVDYTNFDEKTEKKLRKLYEVSKKNGNR